jgi:membrane protein DedA with SNARE-associated domain
MIEPVILFLQSHLLPLGWVGVFLASIVEEIIAPIPSTAVLLVSGAVFLPESASAWETLFFTIAFPAALGITLGSFVVYAAARFLGEISIDRFGKPFGFSRESVERAKEKITRGSRDEISLFFLRAIPIIPSVVISISAGILHIPWKTFLVMTFLGTIPRALFLALIGGQAGAAYAVYAETIARYENFVLITLVILFGIWIAVQYRRRQKKTVIL